MFKPFEADKLTAVQLDVMDESLGPLLHQGVEGVAFLDQLHHTLLDILVDIGDGPGNKRGPFILSDLLK